MKEVNLTPAPNFMKYKLVYFALSVAVIVPGMISLVMFGLNPAIDFTGGSILEIKHPSTISLTESDIHTLTSGEFEIASVQPTDQSTIVIRSTTMTRNQSRSFQAKLASFSASLAATDSSEVDSIDATSAASIIEEISFASVGPTLGKELLRKTIISVILAATAIMIYITYRFREAKYGITAIMAMLHDTLILLGVFSLLGHLYDVEVDTLFVTAVLTTLSFSVHDTIVVYDRIRESQKLFPKVPFSALINKAIFETLGRSINNSLTIIFMLLALWLLGGESIRWFVFALLVGTISGMYSSSFTAAPLLDVWHRIATKKQPVKK